MACGCNQWFQMRIWFSWKGITTLLLVICYCGRSSESYLLFALVRHKRTRMYVLGFVRDEPTLRVGNCSVNWAGFTSFVNSYCACRLFTVSLHGMNLHGRVFVPTMRSKLPIECSFPPNGKMHLPSLHLPGMTSHSVFIRHGSYHPPPSFSE